MTITDQQANYVKQRLLKHLPNFPENQREYIKNRILAMTNSEIEEFIKQNKLMHLAPDQPKQNPQCIFCSIIENKIPHYKIDENKENIAILEINPISKGHCLIVPKKHLEIEKIPSSTFTLAKKIVKRIKNKLKPKQIKISSQNLYGHSLIEVIPLYGNEKERKRADEKELEELQEKLKPKQRKSKISSAGKSTKKKNSSIPKLPPRIP